MTVFVSMFVFSPELGDLGVYLFHVETLDSVQDLLQRVQIGRASCRERVYGPV